MDEKELLKAMSEIKDEYILEAGQIAAEGESAADQKELKPEAKKKARLNWKPWAACIVCAFALCIGIGSMGLFRMGSSKADTAYADEEAYSFNGFSGGSKPAAVAPTEPAVSNDYYYAADSAAEAEMPMPEELDYDKHKEAGNSAFKNETKLIKRASLSLQTTEFDETEKGLYDLVEQLGGYFEYADKSNGSYWANSYYKTGYYTVRVPAEKYDLFLKSVGEGCHIRNLSESVEDIGQQYFDTETRLATLRTKLTRLNELLAKANDLTDIILLENEISNTEYEIDSYTSTLNRYDSLVGYSTITIDLEEVSRVDETIKQNDSFWAQLGRSLKRGILNFVDSLGDLVNWAAYNLIGIIIIVAVILIIRKYHLISKFIGLFKRKNKKDQE